MQDAPEAEASDRAARQGAGAAEGARAEFRDMFVSLVDPAGLLYMDRCAEAAGRMEDAASKAGYGAGARMAAALAGIFADTDRIVDRPVDDGGLYYTHSAFGNMMGVLYDTAEAYRDGKCPEPVARLEEVREAAARLRAEADEYREELRHADPPGSGLDGLSRFYLGRMCRDVVREKQESIRVYMKGRGHDPVFPPKPRPVGDFLGECHDPNMSSADMIALSKGDIPDGYELVRIEDGAENGIGNKPASGRS